MSALSDYSGINHIRSKLQKLYTDKHELAVKISAMNRTVRSEPEYSSARLHNWNQDFSKIEVEESKLLQELATIRNEPAFLKLKDEKEAALNVKRKKMQDEQAATHAQIVELRSRMDDQLLNGGDPLKLVAELKTVMDRERLIADAIEAINSASRAIVRLS